MPKINNPIGAIGARRLVLEAERALGRWRATGSARSGEIGRRLGAPDQELQFGPVDDAKHE
jgi:hypothetical protein